MGAASVMTTSSLQLTQLHSESTIQSTTVETTENSTSARVDSTTVKSTQVVDFPVTSTAAVLELIQPFNQPTTVETTSVYLSIHC